MCMSIIFLYTVEYVSTTTAFTTVLGNLERFSDATSDCEDYSMADSTKKPAKRGQSNGGRTSTKATKGNQSRKILPIFQC